MTETYEIKVPIDVLVKRLMVQEGIDRQDWYEDSESVGYEISLRKGFLTVEFTPGEKRKRRL